MLFSSLFFIHLLIASFLIGHSCSLKCFSPSDLSSAPYNTLSKPANRYGANIILERSGWTGHWVTTALAKILLQEFMGYNITIYDRIGDAGGYQRLATEFEGANFEMWPESQGLPQYKQYITTLGKVVDAGTLGITGRSGWYVPTYVVDQYSQFGPDFWRFYQMGINNALQIFDHAGTTPDELLIGTARAFVPPQCIAETYPPGCPVNEQPYFNRECNVTKYKPCIELLAVDGYYDPGILQQQVRNNNLSIVIPFLGDNFIDRVRSYINNKKPVLLYYWTPTDFVAQNNFTRVALRDPTAECYSNNTGAFNGIGSVNCDFRTQTLIKAYSTTLKNDQRNDDFRNFISTFKISTEIQLEILAQISPDATLREISSFTETCKWIKENFNTWSSWIANHEIRILQSNEQLDVTWDDSIRTLSLALSVLGTWTTLILVEQSIFLKVKGERYVPWLILSTVGQGVCGIWTMHLAGLTSYKLGPGGTVSYIYPDFIPWEAMVSVVLAMIGTVLSFLVMLSHPTFQVKEKNDIDISVSRENQQHMIQATLLQRFISECIYLKTKCDWRVFIGGLLLSMSVMGTFALAQNSAQIPATMTWQASYVFGSIVVAYFGSCITVLLTFHLRGSWRYMTAFIMGVTVFGYHNIISTGITYFYQTNYHKPSSTWTNDTVRLLVSISAAVICLVFIGLNVSRLKLSRNEMEQEIKHNHKLLLKVQAKLNYEKNCRGRDHQQIHELSRTIEFINICRPINRSYAFALAIKHKANITDPILSESTNVPPAGVAACPSTSTVSREDSLVPQDTCLSTNGTSTPVSPAHIAVKIDSSPYIKGSSILPPHPRSNTNKQSIKGDNNNTIELTSYHKDMDKHDIEPISRDVSPIFRERHLSRVLSRTPTGMLKSSSSDGTIMSTDQEGIYRSPSASPSDNERLRTLVPTTVTNQQPTVASSPSGQVQLSEPKPSASGKHTWMKITNPTLLQIINNPVTLELLKDQMISDHTVESLMLYLDIQKYKNISDSNLRKQLSSKIFDTFLNDNSPNQVNISSQMRTEIAKKLPKANINCFEHVESEMISLITSNTLGRFRSSERWVMALLVLNTQPYTDRSSSEHSQNYVSTTTSQSGEEESAVTAQNGINVPSWLASSVNSNQHDEQDTDHRMNLAQDQNLSHVSGVRSSSPIKSNPLYDDAYDPPAVAAVHIRTPPSPSLYLPSPNSPSTLISTIAAGGDRLPIPALEGGLGVPASRSLTNSPQPNDS